MRYIKPMLLVGEAALMATKWFDYRRMHPLKATYYLAHNYNETYKKAVSMSKDKDLGEYVRGFKGLDFLLSKERLSFWRLRQLIDSLGIRYDFYVSYAMKFCLAEKSWKHIPRPAQLGRPVIVVGAMNAWQAECRARIQFCKDKRYKSSNFMGHSDQVAYENFIIEAIKSRQHPQFSLEAALYTEEAVRIEEAILRFPSETLQRVYENMEIM